MSPSTMLNITGDHCAHIYIIMSSGWRRKRGQDEEVQRSQERIVSILIGGVAVWLTCLTMVEYGVYIENTKRIFYHVLSRKSIRRYLGQIVFQSFFRQTFFPIHRFPVRIRLPLRCFFSPVPCPAITGYPPESSYCIPSRYIGSFS